MVPQHVPTDLLPRIFVVTRRDKRKDKYINYVGEYHLTMLQDNQAVPIMLPRLAATSAHLPAYGTPDGLLLVEGEDIGPSYRPASDNHSETHQSAIAAAHPSDATPDHHKDALEFSLVRAALATATPILAICRGSQLLNLAAGGDVHSDIHTQLPNACTHIDYHNYDTLRHDINIVPHTPLHAWFGTHTVPVNSYHHQAISRLAPRFRPMAHTSDHLIEAFYDPHYDPARAAFVVGLQFHPERMQHVANALADRPPIFDHPACPLPFREFTRAAAAFRKRRLQLSHTPSPLVDARLTAEDHFPTHLLDVNDKLGPLRLTSPTPKRVSPRYTKDDLDRIMRSGGTVHGSSLVLSMLQKENMDERAYVRNADCVEVSDRKGMDAWKRLRKRIRQAESAVKAVQDGRSKTEAALLLRRLHDMCFRRMTGADETNMLSKVDATSP